jgi:hypothetical protein
MKPFWGVTTEPGKPGCCALAVLITPQEQARNANRQRPSAAVVIRSDRFLQTAVTLRRFLKKYS